LAERMPESRHPPQSSKGGQISGQEHTEEFIDALIATTVFPVGMLAHPLAVCGVLAIICPE